MNSTNTFKRGFLVILIALYWGCSPKVATSLNEYPNGLEVVNVAYGSVASDELTESVSTFDTPQENIPLSDYLKRVPGVNVTGSGDNAKVLIRGINSLNTNEPLFVLNGTPLGQGYYSVANIVDVNDIRNVSVLKDGASTAMYGTRGSAGVILITTKKMSN